MPKLTDASDRRQIYAMFAGAGIKDKDVQRDIISQFTNGRTDHTTDMYVAEAINLKGHLRSFNGDSTGKDRMRKKILHYAHLLTWKLENGNIDMDRVNNWCESKGKFKKKLNDHDYHELKILVSQFEKVMTYYLTAI